jgi:predicted nucleic acid-binding protein
LALYGQRLDKHWSFIDCVSFEMMRQHGVTDALTTDHHFTQAGFHTLLATSGK